MTTGGNSETSTLGFKDVLRKSWERSAFELKAGAIRAESTSTARIAVGPSNTNFTVIETKDTALSAENYFLNGRYDRTISKSFFWFVGSGWDRNRFAGVENRYSGVAGVGNNWVDTDRVKYRTDYSLTYTREDDVVAAPDVKKDYAGARLSSRLVRKLGATSSFGNDLAVDENLDETRDLRVDMTNWLAASMTSRLALKVSLQWLYDNRPAFRVVDREFPVGTSTGQTVLVELERLDTIVTASLVVNF